MVSNSPSFKGNIQPQKYSWNIEPVLSTEIGNWTIYCRVGPCPKEGEQNYYGFRF